MTALYSGVLVPTSATATSAATGYPALNAASEYLDRPWRATSALAQTLTYDLGASYNIAALMVHDGNFASCTVETSPDNSAWTSQGTITMVANDGLRYRGIVGSLAVSARYIRINISAGTPNDYAMYGTTYYRVGAMFVMTRKESVRSPVYGFAVKRLRPNVNTQLPNGVRAIATTGQALDVISASWTHDVTGSQVVQPIIQRPRDGICILDCELPSPRNWMLWPVRVQSDEDDMSIPNYAVEEHRVELREVR